MPTDDRAEAAVRELTAWLTQLPAYDLDALLRARPEVPRPALTPLI